MINSHLFVVLKLSVLERIRHMLVHLLVVNEENSVIACPKST